MTISASPNRNKERDRAVPTLPPISNLRARRGLSLIELMVSIAVVVIVTSAVMLSLGGMKDAELSASAGKMRGAMRYLTNLAVVNSRPYRLVLDLDSGKYWGEVLLENDPCAWFLEEPDAEKRERAKEYREAQDDDTTIGSRSTFSESKESLLRPRKLPAGVHVTGVLTENMSEPKTSGLVAVHFFPSGRAERAYIWLGVGKADSEDGIEERLTLELKSLMGRVIQHNDVLAEARFFEEKKL